MGDEGFMFSRCAKTLRAFEDRAERERAAAARAEKPERASAHRLLAIQYEADADELRREIAAKA